MTLSTSFYNSPVLSEVHVSFEQHGVMPTMNDEAESKIVGLTADRLQATAEQKKQPNCEKDSEQQTPKILMRHRDGLH